MNSLALKSTASLSRASKTTLFAVLCLFTLFFTAASAKASCGMPNGPLKPMAWHPQNGTAFLESAAFESNSSADPIVGMWHVIFKAQTQDGEPFSGVIDNSIVVWHSDGTEIMNSSRPAQDGNFCLGIWTRTGGRQYYLNHIAWQGNDMTNAPSGIGDPQGGTQIIESVTLSPDGNSYSGSFTLHSYDPAGNLGVWFSGVVTAKRVTSGTSITSLF